MAAARGTLPRADPGLLAVEAARAAILEGLDPLPAEMAGLAEAWNRVLAEPLAARLTQPPHDISAMDGYAVRAAEGAAPRRIAGEAPAGRPFPAPLGPGAAIRVFTGSVIPEGADAVILEEDTEASGGTVRIAAAPRLGQHIRPQGQDFAAGEAILPAGHRLDARAIGLAAAANHGFLRVRRQPRVAILCTGNELALPGDPIPPGGIVSSNGPMLAALAREQGALATLLPLAGDDEAAIAAAAATAASGSDIVVTTGGASIGAHDLIRAGLAASGFRLAFWRIAMRPGKPMLFGHLGATPVLGLPGNPVSAYVCARLFLVPALRAFGGLEPVPPPDHAILGAALPANDHRADHLRARLQGRVATPLARQDSGQLRALAEAGCLILRAPHAAALAAGEEVPILRLSGG